MGDSQKSQHCYAFGPFLLDPVERRLSCQDQVIALTPKVFDLLVMLVENHGRLIEKEYLFRQLWPDTAVEDGNLTTNISTLRKALGELPDERRYIETIPRIGYRFIAQVRVIEKSRPELRSPVNGHHSRLNAQSFNSSAPEPRTQRKSRLKLTALVSALLLLSLGIYPALEWKQRRSQPQLNGIRSLAVLPFTSIGLAKEEEYLGLGLADALITELNQHPGLVVRPTSAVRRYQETATDPLTAGREMGVEAIFTGHLQREATSLRVTLQLLSIRDGALLWSGKFDGQTGNLFGFQDALARHIATALAVPSPEPDRKAVTRTPPPQNEAYQAYLKGRHHLSRSTIEDCRKSLEYFRQAVALDPQFAPGYAGLADAYTLAAEWFIPASEAWPQARQAAEKAIALDPNFGDAHTALALVRTWYDHNWAGAEAEFKQAISISPGSTITRAWYGWFLTWLGRTDEALAELNAAQSHDPLSPLIGTFIGQFYYCTRQFDKAEAELRKVIELDPNYLGAHTMLGWTLLNRARDAEALAEFKKARSLDDSPALLAAYACALARTGHQAEAEKLLRELKTMSAEQLVSPFDYATVCLGAGNHEQALLWLSRAYAAESAYLIYLKMDPLFDPVRSDPRFQTLLQQLRLQ